MEIIAAIDPVTRIEGHLKVQVTIDSVDNTHRVTDARASGTLFRGFEKLLVGRAPRDAQHITERICGICPVAHGMAGGTTGARAGPWTRLKSRGVYTIGAGKATPD